MSFLVVIPARKGSTRVKNKNSRILGEKPLFVHTVEELLKVKELVFDYTVSTNDSEIIDICKSFEFSYIERPDELSDATAKTEDALIHALNSLNKKYKYVICLQPTSPFRSAETISKFMTYALENETTCLLSLTEDRGDYWVSNGEKFERIFKGAPRRQQDREPIYEENSSIYITRVSYLKSTCRVYAEEVDGLPISKIEAFDINTEEDFIFAECLNKYLKG